MRVGRIGYINCYPVYGAIDRRITPLAADLVTGTPSELNDLLAAGELDVSVVSAVEYARNAKERSEEHTSELQSLAYLVCRLLLEKKKNKPRTRSLAYRKTGRVRDAHQTVQTDNPRTTTAQANPIWSHATTRPPIGCSQGKNSRDD